MYDNAVDRASTLLNIVLNKVVGQFPARESRRLTPQQQLEIFMNLTEDDLNELKAQKGEEEFNLYVNDMLKLSRNKTWQP
jgi:hypothetical protein